MELLYIHEEAKLKVEELIVTKGDGNFFPAGLPIGLVDKIENNTVTIRPIVNIGQLDYVSVISDY